MLRISVSNTDFCCRPELLLQGSTQKQGRVFCLPEHLWMDQFHQNPNICITVLRLAHVPGQLALSLACWWCCCPCGSGMPQWDQPWWPLHPRPDEQGITGGPEELYRHHRAWQGSFGPPGSRHQWHFIGSAPNGPVPINPACWDAACQRLPGEAACQPLVQSHPHEHACALALPHHSSKSDSDCVFRVSLQRGWQVRAPCKPLGLGYM